MLSVVLIQKLGNKYPIRSVLIFTNLLLDEDKHHLFPITKVVPQINYCTKLFSATTVKWKSKNSFICEN